MTALGNYAVKLAIEGIQSDTVGDREVDAVLIPQMPKTGEIEVGKAKSMRVSFDAVTARKPLGAEMHKEHQQKPVNQHAKVGRLGIR